jgi:hypothetical protein
MPLEFLDASPHPGQNYDVTAFDNLLLSATIGVEPWTDPKRVIVEVKFLLSTIEHLGLVLDIFFHIICATTLLIQN